jgi:prepilin-type N-terminal cleavage/methylation domain-containing protein
MRNNRKGFTLIELLIVVVIVGILALAAIPLITSNTRDARRAEGTQLLGSARDFCRVTYSKNGAWDATAVAAYAAEVGTGAFDGEYYNVTAPVASSTAVGCIISATALSASDGDGSCGFRWASGESNIVFGAAATIP